MRFSRLSTILDEFRISRDIQQARQSILFYRVTCVERQSEKRTHTHVYIYISIKRNYMTNKYVQSFQTSSFQNL